MFGKLNDITQIIAIVITIRLLVNFARYVFGFRTAKYRSTAKLERLRTEAVYET